MRPVLALIVKDLRLLSRDLAGLFFTFVFPILAAVFLGTMMSGLGGNDDGEPNEIRILIVDEDGTEGSAAFAKKIDDSDQLIGEPSPDRPAAIEAVRAGNRAACVVIPAGWADAADTVFWGEPRTLELIVDPSRGAEAGMIEGLLTGIAFSDFQRVFTDDEFMRSNAQKGLEALADSDMSPAVRLPLQALLGSLETFADAIPGMQTDEGGDGAEGAAAWQPIDIRRSNVTKASNRPAITSAYVISFPQATIWGAMGAASVFGISLVTERNRGTLTRLRVAPLTPGAVLAGKGGACFITVVTVVSMLMVVAALFFGVRPGWASVPLLAMVIASIAACFVGIMMLLSVVGRTEASAGGIGWAAMLVMAMFGGGMIPLFLLRGWMRTVSHFSPIKWGILAMEGVLWRGFSFSELLLPCAMLVGVGVTGFAAGAVIFRVRG